MFFLAPTLAVSS